MHGLPAIDHIDQVYKDCVLAKQKRMSFPKAAKYQAQEQLKLVHGDLCGLISPSTSAENAYFLVHVDDMRPYMWLTLLHTDDDHVISSPG